MFSCLTNSRFWCHVNYWAKHVIIYISREILTCFPITDQRPFFNFQSHSSEIKSIKLSGLENFVKVQFWLNFSIIEFFNLTIRGSVELNIKNLLITRRWRELKGAKSQNSQQLSSRWHLLEEIEIRSDSNSKNWKRRTEAVLNFQKQNLGNLMMNCYLNLTSIRMMIFLRRILHLA